MLKANLQSARSWMRAHPRAVVSVAGAVILALAAAAQLGAACAAESEKAPSPTPFVLSGKNDFLFQCTSCHGLDGKGDGPVAEVLNVKPADLTLLSKRNGGVFPDKRVFETIEGADVIQAHGTREMPVWGPIFEVQSTNAFDRVQAEHEMKKRIQRLVDYLKTIQRK